MTYDEFNRYCRSLKATSYIIQWGGSHVWKVSDKVFAIGGWEKLDKPAFTFKTSAADFFFMQGEPGFRGAPYMASRGMKWIQIYDASELNNDEIKCYLKESHRLVSLTLTKKKQSELGLNQ